MPAPRRPVNEVLSEGLQKAREKRTTRRVVTPTAAIVKDQKAARHAKVTQMQRGAKTQTTMNHRAAAWEEVMRENRPQGIVAQPPAKRATVCKKVNGKLKCKEL